MILLPFSRISSEWRNGPTATSYCSTPRNTKSYYRKGTNQLKSISEKKSWWTKKQQRKTTFPRAELGSFPGWSREMMLPLFSALVECTWSSAFSLVLVFIRELVLLVEMNLLQSPVSSCRDDEGTAASVIWEETEKSESVQCRGSSWESYQYIYKYQPEVKHY